MAAVKIGQLVRYGQAGVCEVREIVKMNAGGGEAMYYALSPLFKPGSPVVYVPCDNEELTGRMRPLLTPGEIEDLLTRAEKAP
ncbi:MAG: CarD family transcriptional regulator, partial [Clostridia bacterium]|nr:CarD family transcriptional regulator [Clostridia bacterium]